MAIRRVVPNVHSDDIAATREFYTGLLGFHVIMDLGWIVTLCAPDDQSTQISIIGQDATAPLHADISVEVDDVDDAHERAVASGVEIVHPLTDESWGVRRFFLRDPNGSVVNVLAHR